MASEWERLRGKKLGKGKVKTPLNWSKYEIMGFWTKTNIKDEEEWYAMIQYDMVCILTWCNWWGVVGYCVREEETGRFLDAWCEWMYRWICHLRKVKWECDN
jgi:hypothetical protein